MNICNDNRNNNKWKNLSTSPITFVTDCGNAICRIPIVSMQLEIEKTKYDICMKRTHRHTLPPKQISSLTLQ